MWDNMWRTVALSGSLDAALATSITCPMSSAWIVTPGRPGLSTTTALACTCVTGTAMAGRPYTTACSPNKIALPGA
jgi:hypothetical protein